MANISEIAQLGAKVLRLQAQAVTDMQSAEIQQIIETMQDTLATTQGVGIAAPQISVSKRIIIIASRPTPRYPSAPLMEPTVMINPCFSNVVGYQGKGLGRLFEYSGHTCISAKVQRNTDQLYQSTGRFSGSQAGRVCCTSLSA